MQFRRPLFINQLPVDVSTSLSRLSGIEGLARSILISVLPLMALKAFGSKDVIATVYFVSTVFTLLVTLNIATLERVLQRRRLVTLGGLFLLISVFFFYSQFGPLFAMGIGLRAAGASIFPVCLSLYIMDYIGKTELTRIESRRMLYLGAAWLIGPFAGSWIYENSSPTVVYVISAVSAVVLLVYLGVVKSRI